MCSAENPSLSRGMLQQWLHLREDWHRMGRHSPVCLFETVFRYVAEAVPELAL